MKTPVLGAFLRRHRLACALAGVVAVSAVVLPACGGGGDNGLDPQPSTGVAASMTIHVSSSPGSGDVLVGSTRQWAALVRDQNNSIMNGVVVSWSILGSGSVATIDSQGIATCVAVGPATIRATGPVTQAGVTLTADDALMCVAAPVPVATTMTVLVTSTPSTGTVVVGVTRQYAVEVRDQSNVVMVGPVAAWSVLGSSAVATITASGLATCAAPGTVTVHAIGPLNGAGVALTGDVPLECVPAPLVPTTMTVLVTSTPATGPVIVAATRQYAVDVRDQNNAPIAGSTAAWSLLGPTGVATISTGGLATCVTVGSVTVHAIGPLNGAGVALTGDISLQCVPVPLVPTTMTVVVTSSPTTGAVYVASTRQYAVDVRDQNGAAIVGSTAAWSVLGPAGVAGISTNGLATCLSAGTVTVQAVGPLNGAGVALTGSVSLQCIPVPPVPTTMVILITSAPTSGSIPVGATRQYTVQVRDQYSAVMAAYTSAAWSIIGTPGIAGIGAGTGLAICNAPGTVTPHAVGPLNGAGVALVASTELVCVASAGNPAVAIVLTPSTLTLSVGAAGGTSGTITASFTDVSGHETANGCTVGFTIGDAKIASGSVKGQVFTVTARTTGTTTVRAECTSGGTYFTTGTISVR